MTVLNTQQMFDLWVHNGGRYDINVIIDALSVALAESGWSTTARNTRQVPNDYGLYQINGVHFGNGIINSRNWADPNVNTRAAIAISANGTNWAAWCTAWANPGPNCGHGHLAHPQAGSPAGDERDQVVQRLRHINLSTPPGAPGVIVPGEPVHVGNASVSQAWDDMRHYINTTGPAQWATMNRIQHAIGKVAN
jgi:hypothetical protein